MNLYKLHIIILSVFCLFPYAIRAQGKKGKVDLHLQVNDLQTRKPLEFALIYLSNGAKHWDAICNEEGKTMVTNLEPGKYKLSVSFIGYIKSEQEVDISSDRTLSIQLKSTSNHLNEVVVTASESKGITSSSIIDRKAMQHLQPSSFTDLLELLPGGTSKNPQFSSINLIKIREANDGLNSSDYNVSSLGVSFVVDGAPISTDANMLYKPLDTNANSYYSTMNKGVDMRAITVDEIERVEIVRGIPSVQYGDLTSGLVRIERKRGVTPWNARLKVDGFSKMIAIGKGFDLEKKHIKLNFGLDFLDSKDIPTNNFSNYQRITYSLRLEKLWNSENAKFRWQSSFDHNHNFNESKVDPNRFDEVQPSADLEKLEKERLKWKYEKFSLANNFTFIPKNIPILKSIDLNTSLSYSLDKQEQVKFVQMNTLANGSQVSDKDGIYDGIYLPSKYLGEQDVDSKPFYAFVQGKGKLEFFTSIVKHKLLAGVEWAFDKNYGKGVVFDPMRPLTGESYLRPRKNSDIPAKQNLNFFVEDDLALPIGRNMFNLNVGLRGMTLLNMESQYKMSNKLYFDPRINAEWSFPAFAIDEKDMNISVAGGLGWHSKYPTLVQIYPDYNYRDNVRLNYYNTDNPEYSRINYHTFKTKTINYDLEPARNKKWELRLNIQYDNNNLSVTYFRENMRNGFRSQIMNYYTASYNKYNNETVVLDPVTHIPNLDLSPYKVIDCIYLNSATGNGSQVVKEGIEYTLSTKRLETLKTRFTISGAWFRTKYMNNTPQYEYYSTPNQDWAAYGVFDSSGGYFREQLNTNFMFDTYIPQLGFEFSTSVQCMWYIMRNNLEETRYPDYYIDNKGNNLPYTEASREDPLLSFLARESNPSLFKMARTPLAIDVNFKASKKIKDLMRISLFVNKLLDYYPDYKVNGATMRRNVNPYFGMELNITI